jgi:Big-like domain-containing protein
MRLHPLVTLMLAGSALAACDQAASPTIAGLGGAGTGPITGGGGAGGTSGTTSSITVLPNTAQLIVGGSVQLSTNAPLALQSQIQWGSLQPAIVAVSPSGLATAVAPGTAVIVARFAFDTTQTGSATITVVGAPPVVTGGTTGTRTP